MRKRLNVKNLILLIIMVVCIALPAIDYLKIIISMCGSYALGFTWYGLFIDFTALFTAELIYQNLFE